MSITKQQYVEYVISTPVNFTCTNLATHLEQVSHDAVNDYLRREKHTAHTLWEFAEPLINNSSESYLVLDVGLSLRPVDKHEFAGFVVLYADNHSINRV